MLQKSSIEGVAKTFVDDVATLCLQVLISRAVLFGNHGKSAIAFHLQCCKITLQIFELALSN
jgi:hypothetical protein